jgi:O-antigen ligase
MAGSRKGTGTVLLVLGGLLLVLFAVWDMTRPDSFLRGLFDQSRNPATNVRSIVDGVRTR